MAANNNAMTIAGAPLAPVQTVEATRAFEPGSIREAVELAKLLVASRLLPRSVATPEAAFTIIATGRELGLSAMQSIRSIHVIEGKPSLSADLVAALVKQRRDVCEFFRLVESTDKVATYETRRVGEPSPTRMSFTIDEASKAGLTGKDNWRKFPAAMLRARCITALARAVYPDLAMGLYDPDELESVPPARAEYEVSAVPDGAKSSAEALHALIESARSQQELDSIALDIRKATLSSDELRAIRAHWGEVKAAIAGAAQ